MNKHLPHNHGNMHEHLQAEMPKPETFYNVSEIFKLLSDSKRAQIFWLLLHLEECVINISALLEMSSPAVSHHLKLLKEAGLVISRREGKEVYYTSAKTPRTEALHKMLEELIEVSCPSIEETETAFYSDSVVQTVNAVRDFMAENLSVRFTIEELALKFHINQTTLKNTFKILFGDSVASYMKSYRVKRGMELLMNTDKSVAEISCEVGYESQSKFSSAFKSITGILPKDYRKIH